MAVRETGGAQSSEPHNPKKSKARALSLSHNATAHAANATTRRILRRSSRFRELPPINANAFSRRLPSHICRMIVHGSERFRGSKSDPRTLVRVKARTRSGSAAADRRRQGFGLADEEIPRGRHGAEDRPDLRPTVYSRVPARRPRSRQGSDPPAGASG